MRESKNPFFTAKDAKDAKERNKEAYFERCSSYISGIGEEQRVSFGAKLAKDENELSKIILDAAFRVHSLGPGLLESAYEACLAYELRNEGLEVLTKVPSPLVYREVRMDIGYRLDLVVEDLVVVKIKAIDSLMPFTKRKSFPT